MEDNDNDEMAIPLEDLHFEIPEKLNTSIDDETVSRLGEVISRSVSPKMTPQIATMNSKDSYVTSSTLGQDQGRFGATISSDSQWGVSSPNSKRPSSKMAISTMDSNASNDIENEYKE